MKQAASRAIIISTLKMEAIFSSETSVDFHRTTRRYIPEDRTLYNHGCENLKSYITLAYIAVRNQNLIGL
jgi:hypothetical protein